MPSSNVLIYRLGSLGDTLIALPCFHLIRKVFPDSKIYLLTNEPVTGKAAPAMAILENSGLCDETISYPVGMRNMDALAALRRTIREIQPSVLINLAAERGLLKSLRDYVFFRTCGIKRIIGTPLRRREFGVRQINPGEFERESQRLASRLAGLGTIDLTKREPWELALTQEERNQASALLSSARGKLIAASVGTKMPVKDWGEENWRKLLAMLAREMRATSLILLGAPDEWERSEKLSRVWTGGHLNFCGKTSPRVSAAILERCSLFIGHDSGPMHLANAAGIPTLALFSWLGPPGQWFPGHKSWEHVKILYPILPKSGWNTDLRMKQGVLEGIGLIRPDDAFTAVMELWDRHSTSAGKNFGRVPAGSTTG